MISPTRDYLKSEVRPRISLILKGAELWISAVVAFGLTSLLIAIGADVIRVGDVSVGLLNYGAIAFGFSVTGMALAVAIPDRDLCTRMAREPSRNGDGNAYSDLLFVFSWTAVAHLGLVVVCLVLLLVTRKEHEVPCRGATIVQWIATTGVTFLATYCVCQFLIAVLTLSQVGSVYIHALRQPPSGGQSP